MTSVLMIPLAILLVCAIVHLLQNYTAIFFIGFFVVAILLNLQNVMFGKISLATIPSIFGIFFLAFFVVVLLTPKKSGG